MERQTIKNDTKSGYPYMALALIFSNAFVKSIFENYNIIIYSYGVLTILISLYLIIKSGAFQRNRFLLKNALLLIFLGITIFMLFWNIFQK